MNWFKITQLIIWTILGITNMVMAVITDNIGYMILALISVIGLNQVTTEMKIERLDN